MVNNNIIVFDFETGGKDCRVCEPIQVAAVVINPRTLELYKGRDGEPIHFESLMQPLDFDKLEDEALAVNKKTREQLREAPLPSVVWPQFASFCKQYNLGGKADSFSSPVPAGHNIMNFDMPIVERLCQQYKILNKEGRQGIFNSVYFHDLLQIVGHWFNGQKEPKRYRLDALREYFGMTGDSVDKAHDALQDVIDTAEILTRFMRLTRTLQSPDRKVKITFKNAFSKKSD